VKQGEILWDDANPSFHGDRIGQGIRPQNRDAAGARTEESGQALDGGRLAGAVGTEEAVKAAGGNREIDAVHRAKVAEVSRQTAGLDGQIPIHAQ